MANQKIIYVLSVLSMMIQSSVTGCKSPKNIMNDSSEEYLQSPCENYSLAEAIEGLWSIPGKVTPLVTELKNTIVSLLPGCNKRVLGILMGASLWTVDSFTEFNIPLLPVFESLINQTITRRYTCSKDQFYQAVNDYGNLCQSAINKTIQFGLRAAGCPTAKDSKEKKIVSPTCDMQYIKRGLKLIVKSMPEKLKDIVLRLSLSSNEVDQAVAMGCAAAATPSSINLFEILMESDELLKVLRLKGCNFKISEKNCPGRKKDLQQECQKLSKKVFETFEKLTS